MPFLQAGWVRSKAIIRIYYMNSLTSKCVLNNTEGYTTKSATTSWTLANDMHPCSHFSSECTHFESDKIKWDNNLALGLLEEDRNCISHRKYWRRDCLPLRASDLIPITKKDAFISFWTAKMQTMLSHPPLRVMWGVYYSTVSFAALIYWRRKNRQADSR